MSEIALIVSSGRTGTQFLAHYFDANYDDATALHEPRPARLLRIASHAHLAGRLSRARLLALLRHKRRRYVDPLRAPLYIESNPFLAGTVDVIGEVWDDPVIVHVVRDPREHARSSINHGTSTGLKGWANRFVPFWYPDVQRILALPERPSWLGQAAGVWTIFNRELVRCGPRYPRYHVLHYEAIFDENSSGLRALCELLGLPFRDRDVPVSPTERINRGRLDLLPGWREWPAEDCRELQRICGPLMQKLGYGTEPEWLERVGPVD